MKNLLVTFAIFFAFFSRIAMCQSDSLRLLGHLHAIIETPDFRNFTNPHILNQVSSYIFQEFDKYGDSTVYQTYDVKGTAYRNVLTSFGPSSAPRIIVGAHYDVCGNQDGADDNASGVAVLLELARLLDTVNLFFRCDLVAYTLEEPPFFRTEDMGSYKHAEYLKNNNIPVAGMIGMDMVGYFNDEKRSQKYPIGLLRLFYGSRGDYLSLVRKNGEGKFSKESKKILKEDSEIEVKSIKAPASIPGIDFSDHLNYWAFGYEAIFLTNTGFYRNQSYHTSGDVLEKLDIQRLKYVSNTLYKLILDIQEVDF